MPIQKEILDIMIDPETKVGLEELSAERLAKLNAAIGAKQVKNVAGQSVEEPLAEALITKDSRTIYPILDGIPILLHEQGIPVSQIADL